MSDGWQNGLAEAVARMREHLDGDKPIRFDARDRQALSFILDLAVEESKTLAAVMIPSTTGKQCGGCARGDHAECSGWCFCSSGPCDRAHKPTVDK